MNELTDIPMAESEIYQEITDHLHQMADPETAEHSQRFFKTAEGQYGYGDKFLGIRVPVLRRAVKKYLLAPLSVAERLLRSEFHEIRLFALLLLVARFGKGDAEEQGWIYRTYLAHTRHVNNWDLVDSSAPYIVGAYLGNRNKSILDKLAGSDALWERRIAIMATFHFIRKGNFHDTLRIAEQLLGDREDLIHKATGWMLREVGRRDLRLEVDFLKDHYRRMPRTMLRYAIEKFDPTDRRKYLRGEI
jgi:3-methyladenine DNA glycosylase AlkD